MKNSNTSERLKELMKKYNYRQVDILEKCKPFCEKYNVKLGRNDLSQYVNGKVEPRQDKLTILGMALNVNEAWLMGYDAPMHRVKEEDISDTMVDLVLEDQYLLEVSKSMKILNEKSKKRLLRYIDLLIEEQEND